MYPLQYPLIPLLSRATLTFALAACEFAVECATTLASWLTGWTLWTLLSTCTCLSIGTAIWVKLWPIFTKPMLFSWLLHHGAIRSPSEERYRRDFSSLKMRRFREKDNHSHGTSAGKRTVAKRFMADFALKAGLNPFQVQQSRNDQKHGVDGSRTFYWSKDMTMDYKFKTPGKHDIVLMTDVDYYIDMPWFLAWNAKPVLLYSFVPSTLAKSTGETSHCFHADNTVEYRISGGGCYQHKLWDYSADNLVSTWKVCGIPVITTVYHIERRNIDEDHMMILLTPISYFYGPWAWLASLLDGYRLKRLEVVDGEYTRMRVQEKDQLYMCTGKVGKYVHAKLPIEADDAIGVAARIMKNEISPPTTMSYMGNDSEHKAPAVVVTAYHRATTGFKPPVVYPVHYGVKDYVYKPEVFFEHAKSSLVSFMSPIIDACYSPTDCKENEEVCIEERITKILSDKDMPDEYKPYMLEFIKLLVPDSDVGTAVKADLDDVYARQNRPNQRKLIDEGSFYGPFLDRLRNVKPFQKKEPYTEPKPPRNISTINSRDKIDYSCYIYAAAERFKARAPWYAFGKVPRKIAKRVARICTRARKQCVNSDLSRFDGRLALAFRILEEAVLLRMFPVADHDKIIELHNSQFGLRGRARHGTEYFTGYSRLSGSPETALFNSLANAFMVFVTKRVCGQTADEAWDTMGIYGGDDGLTADLDVATYTKVCDALGMKTTAEEVPKGKPGIKFLARLYSPQVWNGDMDSCADFLRQLSKFHATPHLPSNVSEQEKLIEKARGFFLSDRNTPVIGQLATKVMALTIARDWTDGAECVCVLPGGDQEIRMQVGTANEIAAQSVIDPTLTKEIRNYASIADADDQYPNTNECGWMLEALAQQIPTFSFSRFEDHLDRCDTLERVLKFPLCAEPVRPKVTAPVIVQDETLLPEKPKEEPKPDPHAAHTWWSNPKTCYACHPELNPKTKGKENANPERRIADTTTTVCAKPDDPAVGTSDRVKRSKPRDRLVSVPTTGESSTSAKPAVEPTADGASGTSRPERKPGKPREPKKPARRPKPTELGQQLAKRDAPEPGLGGGRLAEGAPIGHSTAAGDVPVRGRPPRRQPRGDPVVADSFAASIAILAKSRAGAARPDDGVRNEPRGDASPPRSYAQAVRDGAAAPQLVRQRTSK